MKKFMDSWNYLIIKYKDDYHRQVGEIIENKNLFLYIDTICIVYTHYYII